MNRFATILVALLASAQAPAATGSTPPNAASAATQAANAGVLNHGKPLADPDSTLTLSKQTTMQDAMARGDVKVEGRPSVFGELMGMLVTYPGRFNIVTP